MSADEPAAPAVVTVTPSPAWDLTISTPHLDLGRSHRIDAAAGRLGGKGINVARVLAAVGTGAYVQGPVAREHWPESGEAIGTEGSAPAAGPVWDLTPTPSRLRRSYAVVEEHGRATVLNERGTNQPPSVWTELQMAISRRLQEPSVSVLAVSGSTPADCPDDFYPDLVSAAHAAGVSVIVDTSGPALLAAARAGADWIKPNDDELRELFTREDTVASAAELAHSGGSRVLLSRGEDGLVLVDETGPIASARLGRVLHGNPTGAGDASVAALARGLAVRARRGGGRQPGPARLSDDDIREILTDTVALSASAVLMPQAGEVHPDWRSLREEVIVQGPAQPARGGRHAGPHGSADETEPMRETKNP